ncbi:MAG TPA: c-type cytochrome [Thermoanaerobaculia bacterium]|nr:c-type cytochrome [Thermoanaerobaculia bacterium]
MNPTLSRGRLVPIVSTAALVVVLAGLLAACAQPPEPAPVPAEPVAEPPGSVSYLLQGNAAAGRAVFEAMSCHSCHPVAGESFPPPVAEPSLQITLDASVADQPPEQLAESIIAPSHSFAASVPREGPLSPMGDFSEAMTVRDLIDLTTYLHSLGEQDPG